MIAHTRLRTWFGARMWLGVLTPGAHPSRPHPTDEATLIAWTAEARARIDGPALGVHEGLRMLRDRHRLEGEAAHGPRCFVCRTPIAVPDAAELRADPDVPGLPDPDEDDLGWDHDDANGEEALLGPWAVQDASAGVGEGEEVERATFLLVHLDPAQDGRGHEEEALVCVVGTPLCLLVPLEAVGLLLPAFEAVAWDVPAPRCDGCGQVLPGGADQRSRAERRAEARSHRRVARTRR